MRSKPRTPGLPDEAFAHDGQITKRPVRALTLSALAPEWAIGVGGFAERRLHAVLEGDGVDSALARRTRIGQILHPSPASPAANRGWAEAVDRSLAELAVLPAARRATA